MVLVLMGAMVSAHDFERTQVSLTLSRDGSFVLDVTNDTAWLTHRLIPFSGPFADRVVLFVDGREIRPESTEYLPPPARSEPVEGLATYRMRGRMPLDARTLRFFYGLVIDPYPLTIRRADRRIIVEEVQGDAWSGTIDLSGQFQAPLISQRVVVALLAGLLVIPLILRIATKTRKRETNSFFVLS